MGVIANRVELSNDAPDQFANATYVAFLGSVIECSNQLEVVRVAEADEAFRSVDFSDLSAQECELLVSRFVIVGSQTEKQIRDRVQQLRRYL